MRILSITAQKPDSTGSGIYLTELMNGFDRMGHEQAAVVGVTAQDVVRLPERARVYPVYYRSPELPYPVAGMSDEMPYESTRYCDMTDEMTQQFRSAFGRVLTRAVEEFDPDVILCHHLYYLTALTRSLFPRRRVFVISHGSDLRQFKKNPWQRAFIREQICRLDGIFALHQEHREEILACHTCPEERVQVIGTGYNNRIFCLDRGKEPEGGGRTLRLIFAGKLAEKKGVMSLLRALPRLEELLAAEGRTAALSLAGGYGNEEEYRQIRELAAASPCPVEFLGKLAQRELAEQLNRQDVFVLPSFYEGLPLVLAEAMACGLRVVCTDLRGIRPWLEEKGLLESAVFVEPPRMRNEDEPVAESLPDFEERLARAIQLADTLPEPDQTKVRAISWDGLCERLLEKLR